MSQARVSGTTAGATVIDFLRRAVDRYGSRDALLFKPAFRYIRWSYSRLWRESGQVGDPAPVPWSGQRRPSHHLGPELATLGADFLRLSQGRHHRGTPRPPQCTRLCDASGIPYGTQAGLHLPIDSEGRRGPRGSRDNLRGAGGRHNRPART